MTITTLAFNPYLFAILLTFTLLPQKKRIYFYVLAFIPLLFNYQFTLLFIIGIQIIVMSIRYLRKNVAKFLLLYYLVLILVPILSELIGAGVQLAAIGIFHYRLDYIQLNLICFIPEILVCLLLGFILQQNNNKISEIETEVNSHSSMQQLLIWMTFAFTISTYTIWTILDSISIPSMATLLLMIVALVITIILIINLYETIRQNHKILNTHIQIAQFKQIQEYSQRLENANIELRKSRHDHKNSLLALNGYLLDSDIKGAQKYLNYLVMENNRLQKATHTMTIELANLKVKELKYLLIDKLQRAQDKGIKVRTEINKEITYFPCNIVSLIRCIGIFLDNAIEACQNLENPQINILLTKYSNDNYSFVIENTIKTRLNLTQVFKAEYTSKNNHQGLGLANVSEIVNNSSNLSLNVEQNKNMISFELTISNGGDK